MYLGMSLQESIFWFNGKLSGTHTKQLCYVLRHQGIEVAINARLKVIYRGVKLPHTGILRVTWKPPGKKVRQGHWVLKVGNYVHDPEREEAMELSSYMNLLPLMYGKITSFLELPAISYSYPQGRDS